MDNGYIIAYIFYGVLVVRVKLNYIDRDSISPQEIALNAKRLYGDNVVVELLPESSSSRSHIRHAIKLDITSKQLSAYFDEEKTIYETKLEALKAEFINTTKELLEEITTTNVEKWSN